MPTLDTGPMIVSLRCEEGEDIRELMKGGRFSSRVVPIKVLSIVS